MRYVEGRFDQFESQDKIINGMEKYEIIEEYRSRQMEMAGAALGQVKEYITNRGETTGELPYKTETDQMPKGKKAGMGVLIFVIVLFAVIIVLALLGNIILTIGAFFGGFTILALYAAITGNARSSSFYEGQTSTGSRKTGIWLAAFGLSAIVPLFFYSKFGMKGTLILMGACIFSMGALFGIVGLVDHLTIKVRKYREEVQANCVGYVRTVRQSSSTSRGESSEYYLSTSPLFEYYYEGQMYKGLYDRPIDGRNGDIDMGSTVIRIDPNHPEDIYHGSGSVAVKGLLMGVICLGVAGFLFYNFFTNDYAEKSKDEITPMKIISILKDPDSLGDEGYEDEPSEITDEYIEKHYILDEWYVEEVKIDRVITESDGTYTVYLVDEAFPSLGQEFEPGSKELVFYQVEEKEQDGETKIETVAFLWLNADEHTYKGDHGAYEK